MTEDGWTNKIIQGDSLELIPGLPDDFVDLVITSPPYHIGMVYDIYDDVRLSHEEYIAWLQNLFAMLKSKMKTGGRICVNIGDQKNGQVTTHSDIIQFMTKELGYLIKTSIIWHKHQLGNRTSWGSWKSPSNPSFPTPFEYIMVFCKDSQEKVGRKEDITITKEEFITNSLALWEFKPETRMKRFKHPAMFPLELPYRLIQSLSYKGDLVLDPFSGVGTACLAAKISGRKYVGFELSEKYTNVSIERLASYIGFDETEKPEDTNGII